MILAQAADAATAPGFGDVTVQEVFFVLLGIVAIVSAVLVVTAKNVVHAALFLVVTLAAVAAEYLMLTADFVAWVQVLIYVGAVIVLILFGIMLTKAPIGGTAGLDSGNRLAGLVVALASAATLTTLLVSAFRHAYVDLAAVKEGTGGEELGAAIFSQYILPFEVVSILLLSALIGSIVLSRRDEGGN